MGGPPAATRDRRPLHEASPHEPLESLADSRGGDAQPRFEITDADLPLHPQHFQQWAIGRQRIGVIFLRHTRSLRLLDIFDKLPSEKYVFGEIFR